MRLLKLLRTCVLVNLAVIPLVVCLTDHRFNAPIDFGTFKNPASVVRPRFRYWLPDSSVDIQTVADDIASSGAIGAGGVEFLTFFEYGGQIGSMPPGADWSTYGFGTPPFRKVFKAALEAHKLHGLKMDFALGPNQGQGIPAEPNSEGLQWDLVCSLLVGAR